MRPTRGGCPRRKSWPRRPGRAPGTKREQYRTRFTEMIGAGNLGTAWKEQLAGGLVLGGNDFVAKVRKLLKGDRTEQKSIRTLENPPVDWATIVAAIEKRALCIALRSSTS